MQKEGPETTAPGPVWNTDSGSWWWTGRPGMLQFMGSQRVRHDWATQLTDWLKVGSQGPPRLVWEVLVREVPLPQSSPYHLHWNAWNATIGALCLWVKGYILSPNNPPLTVAPPSLPFPCGQGDRRPGRRGEWRGFKQQGPTALPGYMVRPRGSVLSGQLKLGEQKDFGRRKRQVFLQQGDETKLGQQDMAQWQLSLTPESWIYN